MNPHIQTQQRLDDYVDELLRPEERGAVLQHLAGCADCRDEVEAIVSLRAAARDLPREIAPPRDLWAGIAARLEPRPAAGGPAAAPARTPVIRLDLARRAPVWQRWGAMAAAAAVLVVMSSAATAYLLRAPGGAQTAAGPTAVPVVGSTAALAAWQPVEAEYLSSVEALQAELDARRDALAPETVAVIEQNLQIIDQAIADARAALEADPGSADLPMHLADVYRQKVQLLQTAVQLPAYRT